MQSLEIVLIVLGSALLTGLLTGRAWPSKWVGVAALLAASTVATQIVCQGYRWHMVPAYFAIALVLFCSGLGPRVRIVGAVLATLSLSAAFALATVFPVFRLPAPTGRYPVGTLTFTLIDSGRLEAAGQDELRPRELPVQLFYPAQSEPRGHRAFYMPRAETTQLKPQVSLARVSAVVNAQLASHEHNYPLLIYSPSWGGNRHENTNLMEDLASHGYIVACLDVPGETMATVFPNGRIVRTRNDPWLDFSSQQQFERTRSVVNRHLGIRVADVRFVLDQLAWLDIQDSSGKFYQRIDLNRVGVLGFSFGGSTAAQACRLDPRFKAGANLDGFSFGLQSDDEIPCPFLIVGSGGATQTPASLSSLPLTPYDKMCANDEARADKSIQFYGGYILNVRGAAHTNFTDQPLYCRLRRYSGAGSIDPKRAMFITRTYVRTFFDRELRALPETLLDGPSSLFPEVSVLSTREAVTGSVARHVTAKHRTPART